MIKFGIVGAVAFVVDLGLFNILRATVLSGYGNGPLSRAVIATIISAAVATCVAWIGNRVWTFRHRRNRPVHHEALLFALTNGVALLIQAGCVGFSHHVLGQETLVAENVAKLRRHRARARCSGSGPTAGSSSATSRSSDTSPLAETQR